MAGQYAKFPAAFQERLQFYKENGIGVCFVLAYDNPKAYPNSAERPYNSVDPAAFAGYAVEVAKQLKTSGVRFVLELWNEPHNFVLRKLIGGEWNAKPPSPWVDHYLKIVSEAVKQVKNYDPSIKVLNDDDMWIIHYWFLEKGLPRDLDGFAFHPYSGASSGPEIAAVGQEANWTKPFTVVDANRSFQSAVRRLRAQAVLKLGKVPALWATEWGWGIGEKAAVTTLTPQAKVTEDAVAAYLPRAFITAAASGVEVVFWFSSYDSVDGPMGLRANGGKQRKAYGAFRTMTRELGASRLVKQVIGGGHLTSGVQAYLFHGRDANKHVLWNIDGEESYLAPQHTQAISGTDVHGRELSFADKVDGRTILHLSQAPIYVSGLPEEFALESIPAAVKTQPVYLFR